jgi:hypothetical protein
MEFVNYYSDVRDLDFGIVRIKQFAESFEKYYCTTKI